MVCPLTWAANVTVGTHVLLPNTADQVVMIQVTGGEQVAGEDFFAQIGDGGTFLGGSDSKPAFTNVDVLSGTVFAASNNGAYGDPNGSPPGSNAAHPLIWVDGTTTVSGTVPANGLLAALTIDTTGLNSGIFPLLLSGVADSLGPFDTTLRNASGDAIPLSIGNGALVIAIPGDYNQNGIVEAADYVLWRNTLGQTGVGLAADGDGDSEVDADDYDIWTQHFGDVTMGSGTTAAAVPEPGTLQFVLLVACCALRMWRLRGTG